MVLVLGAYNTCDGVEPGALVIPVVGGDGHTALPEVIVRLIVRHLKSNKTKTIYMDCQNRVQ